MTDEPVSYGRRLRELANRHPEKTALVFATESATEQTINWRILDERTNQVARLLAELGVVAGAMIVVAVRNSPEHFVVTIAAWKLGAFALPLRWEMPRRERDEILKLADPPVVFAAWDDLDWPRLTSDDLARAATYPVDQLPDATFPGKALASGGSTGRPKIIVDRSVSLTTPPSDPRRALGMAEGQVQLVSAPLYHNSPFLWSYRGLALDHTLIVMERFDAAHAVDLIERHRVSYAYFPPIIMRRIAMLPGVHERDFSSLEAVHSSAAPCPDWLKRFWIDLLGPEKVYEVYGSTEGFGAAIIRGDEWMEHPGSVGLPVMCELRILGEDGCELPHGEVGEVFMRPLAGRHVFEYVGAPPIRQTPDGFCSVGDLGWVDDDGFLYIADRRVDMIVSGGANVYPAEVEAALSEHPQVADVAVIGMPDDDWGRRVHAVVQPREYANPPAVMELDAHCRERMSSYKVPKTYEFLAELPRNEAGKIRRSALAAERESGWDGRVLTARTSGR